MLVQTLPAARGASLRPIEPSANREDSALYCVRACMHEAHFRDHLPAVYWVRGGRAHVTLGGRPVVVDDDTYLIVNEGRSYDVRLTGPGLIHLFAVYFRRGLASEVLTGLDVPLEGWLDEETAQPFHPIMFDDHLQTHDSLVSPVLRFMERHLDLGVTEPAWYEEQVIFLLERMFRKEVEIARREAAVGAARRATRREVVRRVALATDYIQSCYERPIALADMGAAAALSPHHLLRLFKLVHGCTPREYLQAKRTRVAARLIATTELTLEEIAHRVGFEDRSTLGRQLRRTFGKNPRQMRKVLMRLPARPEVVGSQSLHAPAPRPDLVKSSGVSSRRPSASAPRASVPSKAAAVAGATFEVLAVE